MIHSKDNAGQPPNPFLNVFEIDDGERIRHLICLLEQVLAGARGIDWRAVVGEFHPDEEGTFHRQTFHLNPGFITTLTEYMNEVAVKAPELAAEARSKPSQWIYLLDPRINPNDSEHSPRPADLLGCFAVDESGQIVPKSFQYNEHHVWFDEEAGYSGLLRDRRFHDWIHQVPER